MMNLKVMVLCVLIVVASSSNTSAVDNKEPPPPQPPKPNPDTTVSPIPTTTKIPTTTTPSTPKTTPTSTTTTKPTSTPTTTPVPPPTTTTPKPTPAPTTTPKPTQPPTPPPPVPEPTRGNWSVNYPMSNDSCILVDMAAQIGINNKTDKINISPNATALGKCSNSSIQNITLSWKDIKGSYTLTFVFKLNNSEFDLEEISSHLNLSRPTGFEVYNLYHEKPEFTTPVENSYKCVKVQTLQLTDEKSNATDAYIQISNVQFQAFANTTKHTFADAKDCQPSVTPDVVPIVVGCVLAVLVVMVLIAYLIGRRRCQARGYLSM